MGRNRRLCAPSKRPSPSPHSATFRYANYGIGAQALVGPNLDKNVIHAITAVTRNCRPYAKRMALQICRPQFGFVRSDSRGPNPVDVRNLCFESLQEESRLR
jgi:hypothetical protein